MVFFGFHFTRVILALGFDLAPRVLCPLVFLEPLPRLEFLSRAHIFPIKITLLFKWCIFTKLINWMKYTAISRWSAVSTMHGHQPFSRRCSNNETSFESELLRVCIIPLIALARLVSCSELSRLISGNCCKPHFAESLAGFIIPFKFNDNWPKKSS